jgi:hypothetical protein
LVILAFLHATNAPETPSTQGKAPALDFHLTLPERIDAPARSFRLRAFARLGGHQADPGAWRLSGKKRAGPDKARFLTRRDAIGNGDSRAGAVERCETAAAKYHGAI